MRQGRRDAAESARLGLASGAIALVSGAVVALLAPRSVPIALCVAIAASGVGLWIVVTHWRWRRIARALAIALLGFALAAAHATLSMALRLPATLEREDVRVRGRIVDLPVEEDRRTRFHLRVDDDRTQHVDLRGRLLRLSWYGARDEHASTLPRVHAGARWEFDVRLRAPRGLRNPGWFDAERHALAHRLAATGYVRNPTSAHALTPPHGLQAWRANMAGRIDIAVADPVARFVRALALGDTRGLDDADWATLRATGLTHLIAISGFHVGLVAGFFALVASAGWRIAPHVARHLPRPIAMAIAAVLGATLYTAVAGFALPTVRTTLMIAAVAAVRCARRAHASFDALAVAVIAMVAFDPLSLLGAGFWLSVCGVAWLLWCLPRVDGIVRSFAAAQAVATIGLLPLTVALFGQASLAGPLANLVAIPWWSLVVVPLALLGTGLDAIRAGAGDWAWRLAGHAFDLTWPAFAALGESRFAFAWLPEARWFALPMAAFGAFWLLLPRGVPGKPLASILWLPLLWPSRDLPPNGAFRVDVLDVGQGLSVLVRTTTHATLFDMGPASHDGYDAGERAVVPALRALGVRTLDVAIVSHGDSDHAGGWPSVRDALPVREVHAPEGSPTPSTRHCIAGHEWTRDGVHFRYLHPTTHFPYLGNDAGCVLRIEGAHGTAALLTGDIGEVVERTLARSDADDLRADVVLIPHHGSEGSSDPAFITATRARFALVATGAGNRFGHPREEVVARWCRSGARVLGTADGGALRIDTSPRGVNVASRRATHARLWDAVPRSARKAGLCYRPNDGPGPEE